MLLVGTTFAVIYLQITIALPLTLTVRGLGPSSIGLLLTASAATVVLCQPLLAHPWLRALDDFAASTLGYLVLAAGLLATGFVTSLPAFLVATVLWSVGDVVLMGRAYTIVAGLAPATARGRYLAVYGTSWGVAAIVAPAARHPAARQRRARADVDLHHARLPRPGRRSAGAPPAAGLK